MKAKKKLMKTSKTSSVKIKRCKRKFIFVFEGVTGSKREDIIKGVLNKLKDEYLIKFDSEPLDKSVVLDEVNNSLKIALYVADRYKHIKRILKDSFHDIFLIDRYLYSTLAFQGLHANASELRFIKVAQSNFPRPDLIFYIKTPLDQCFKNQKQFSLGELKKLKSFYDIIFGGMTRIEEIDGTLPLEVQINQVKHKILDIIK